jgi:hypothetical protein
MNARGFMQNGRKWALLVGAMAALCAGRTVVASIPDTRLLSAPLVDPSPGGPAWTYYSGLGSAYTTHTGSEDCAVSGTGSAYWLLSGGVASNYQATNGCGSAIQGTFGTRIPPRKLPTACISTIHPRRG